MASRWTGLTGLFAKLNGAVSCAIGSGGSGGGGGSEKSAYQSWYDGMHNVPGDIQDGPGIINEGFGGQQRNNSSLELLSW